MVATPAGGDVERKRGRNAVKCLWGKEFLSQNTATLGVCTCYKWLLHPPAYSGFAGASRIGFLPRRGETFPEIDESFADLSAGQDKGSLKGEIWCLKAESAVVSILEFPSCLCCRARLKAGVADDF